MLNFAVTILDNSYCSSVTGVIDVFQVANAHCRRAPEFSKEPFQWSLLSTHAGEHTRIMGGITMISNAPLSSAEDFDLLYLPAGHYPGESAFDAWLKSHSDLYEVLQRLVALNKMIAANCTSTFLLAEAGLLDGKTATTTWWLESQFKQRFPMVNLETDKALTEDHGIYCAGALNAYQKLALHLVETYASPEIAALTAKSMLINRGQGAQTPYFDLDTTPKILDPLVSRAQYKLRNNLNKTVDFSLLCRELEVSQRTLIRRFNQATGTTPLKFLQNLRLETSKTLLTSSQLSVADIMEKVGYTDPSSFNRLFKKRVGLTPSVFRQRFSAVN